MKKTLILPKLKIRTIIKTKQGMVNFGNELTFITRQLATTALTNSCCCDSDLTPNQDARDSSVCFAVARNRSIPS